MTSQRGFSLIEALIALLVLSLGLVGVAAMQLKALQSASVGYQRSVASVAAVDAQERLWAQLATLDPDETCKNINIEAVETAWKNHWFQEDDHSPLRGALPSLSSIGTDEATDGCRISINVALSDEDADQFDYSFRLPLIGNSS
ncbi:type IV pilus modification protein PilV [Halomonas sp. CUBES01]|uniref:Type IV pilus modification protein PilV n=1 Tax=Vreelandella gomseomensis TaxID=370766 RepID=A0ABU1GGH2_9GAMM|nr:MULTISPECIES: type IV pilus modification protein PilV [Halomonas]MDR5876184.1 type IV pilus modification protein PilV [Halomonas gomseomensis]MEC4768494.1 type IV pilus modification protein PilV [Halomonas sp. CUBES01]